MSEPRATDEILRELRSKAPPAPPRLRERVRAVTAGEPQRRPLLRLRPALAAAAAAVVAVGVGAALVDGLRSDEASIPQRQAGRDVDSLESFGPQAPSGSERDSAAPEALRATTLPPGARLQRYTAFMRIRVKTTDELSDKTKSAMRDARSLGGYIVSVRYGTPEDGRGDATLTLRVPIARVQEAIARFSSLGTLVTQRISLDDIQPQADRLAKQIAARRARIRELEAKQRRTGLTDAELAELRGARRALDRLTRRRTAVVREGTYARVTLELTTRKPAEKREEPGRFDTFWDDASKILATELIWLLYALVVAGPFVLLAVLAWLAERGRRRRANDALLADH